MRFDENIAKHPHCSTGKLHLKATMVYYNFALVNVKDLTRRMTIQRAKRARGSPLKHIDNLCL
jgi:hypothetical protein